MAGVLHSASAATSVVAFAVASRRFRRRRFALFRHIFGARHQIQGLAGGIDDRRAGDADFAAKIAVSAARRTQIARGNRRAQINFPQRRGGFGIVGIESVNVVTFCRHEHHIARARLWAFLDRRR